MAFSAALAAVSCIGVDYAYVDEGNGAPEGFGKTPVSLSFDWTGKKTEEIPGKMSVLMPGSATKYIMYGVLTV